MKTGIITQILLILNEKVDFKKSNKLKIIAVRINVDTILLWAGSFRTQPATISFIHSVKQIFKNSTSCIL